MQTLGFGDEGFDVAGVEVGQAGGQPVGVCVAEDAGEVRGEVMQVFAGVVEVHDGGGLGQDRGGQVPDPGRPVAEDDELADVIGAAAAGFGVYLGGEFGGGGEAGQIAGGVRVAHRPAVGVNPGLGEQAGQFDLTGAGSPVGGLAGAVGDRGGHHRHAGAIDGDIELVRHHRRWQRADPAARDGGGLGLDARRGGGAVVFGAAFDPLGRQPDSGQLVQQVRGRGERGGRGGARSHLAQPRRQRHPRDTELVVTRNDAAPA